MNELILLCAGAAADTDPDARGGMDPPRSAGLDAWLARGGVIRDDSLSGTPLAELPEVPELALVVVGGDRAVATIADCAARGGTKNDGSKGWMSHAWVVEGCESPWGVFSAASPVLDWDLGQSSGKDDGHCAGSGVRDRYDMDEAPATPKAEPTGEAAKDTSATVGN